MTDEREKSERLGSRGSAALRPRARLIRALGADLISDEVVALVELIKNSYDADSSGVLIEFHPPLEPEKGRISISDDGHGMDINTVLHAWFEPATSSKTEGGTSPGGRPLTGSKGIGRFAAARLGAHMHMTSVTAIDPAERITVDFDWAAFEEDAYLDEVKCNWERESVTTDTPAGTDITITRLRDEWTEGACTKLRNALSRLMILPEEASDFAIELKFPPPLEAFSGEVTVPEVIKHPHYSIKGHVSSDGSLAGTCTIGATSTPINATLTVEQDAKPTCGAFSFEFRVWDRDRESLKSIVSQLDRKISLIRQDLDEASGIRLYRDAFRVLPYGEPDNDWLRLDIRRVQNPTLRLSNNQISGVVRISSQGNPRLRDQTNREGLVDGPALQHLRELIVAVLAKFEQVRFRSRPTTGRTDPTPAKSLFDDLSLDPLLELVRKRYPKDTVLLRSISQHQRQADRAISRVQTVLVRYRRLATLGQLIDIVLHDGRTPLSVASTQCKLALREMAKHEGSAKWRERLRKALRQLEALSGLFNRIEPFGGRKRGRPTEMIVEEMIHNAFELYSERIKRSRVEVSLPSTSHVVTFDPTEFQQVVVNLLDNALYWLARVPADERRIQVECSRTPEGLEVLFADSGPGVPPDDRESIFTPYYSTKPEGVGLGLAIVGEVISDYDGHLELVSPGLLEGATFRLLFRKRSGG